VTDLVGTKNAVSLRHYPVGPLNALLDEMSGEDRAELWTASALGAASAWERVRSLARDLLFSIEVVRAT
jgi:hypothetical protein